MTAYSRQAQPPIPRILLLVLRGEELSGPGCVSSSGAASEHVFSSCTLMTLSGMIYRMMRRDHSVFPVDPENLAKAAVAFNPIFHALTRDSKIPCYAHCYGLLKHTVVPPLSRERQPRAGLQVIPKEGSCCPGPLEQPLPGQSCS